MQKAIEKVNGWLEKWKRYTRDLHICGDRNSYCKTDHDATFMHMKEDHMRNGQLKPGYNVNVATSEEFIIGNYISSDRNDMYTLIPLAEYLKRYGVKNICADSGYESEENYCWFEDNGELKLYVKPSNHEQKKTKTRNGFETETSVYSCKDCSGCPMKDKCIRACGSKKKLEERSKVIYVSKRFARQRAEMEKRISSDEGKLIRVNRSIQAEGVFSMTKEDMGFVDSFCAAR